MSRIIKFRIWSRQNKCFVDNGDSLHCFSNWSIDAFTGEIIDYVGVIGNEGKTYTAAPDPNYYFEGVKAVKEKRYVTQQWTGMFDKNNLEIYEGDIVKLCFDPKECETLEGIEEVKWNKDYCGFLPFLYRYLGLISAEVIGNIFESPDLLKL